MDFYALLDEVLNDNYDKALEQVYASHGVALERFCESDGQDEAGRIKRNLLRTQQAEKRKLFYLKQRDNERKQRERDAKFNKLLFAIN